MLKGRSTAFIESRVPTDCVPFPFRCSVVSVTAFGDETMSRIFTVLVDWWMRKAHYPPAVTKLRSPMVSATLDIYQVRASFSVRSDPFRSNLLYLFFVRHGSGKSRRALRI